jgi:hypothetical protein
MPQRNISIKEEEAMSRSPVMMAVLALITPALAAELPKSGSFKTPSAFKGIEQATQVGGRVLSHGVVYGIVTEDNPLHIKTANCPYISDIDGDTVTLRGECAWTDGQDNIFTEWNTKFSASKGTSDGAQTFIGGSGKFNGIQGSNPFQCQVVGKEGQFTCTQNWTYQLPK